MKQPQSEELKAQAKWDLKVHLCRAWEVIRVYNVVNRKGRHKLQAIQDLSRGEAYIALRVKSSAQPHICSPYLPRHTLSILLCDKLINHRVLDTKLHWMHSLYLSSGPDGIQSQNIFLNCPQRNLGSQTDQQSMHVC